MIFVYVGFTYVFFVVTLGNRIVQISDPDSLHTLLGLGLLIR